MTRVTRRVDRRTMTPKMVKIGLQNAGQFSAAVDRIVGQESLLAASLAAALLFISISARGTDTIHNGIKLAAFGILATVISLTLLSGLTRPKRKVDTLALLVIAYFVWTVVQNLTQSLTEQTLLSLVAVLLTIAATSASLERLFSGLRRWILVLVIATLAPAFVGQGFNPGRVWLGLAPGRYGGFSGADQLGFIAGLAILLSIPVLRSRQGRVLFLLGGFLLVITATYTTAIAVSLAVPTYYFLFKIKSTRSLKRATVMLGVFTVGALTWIQTDQGIDAFESLSQKVSLSNRTLIWVQFLRLSRGSGHFWTGLGDRGVMILARGIKDVPYAASAHNTLIQMLLSKGFITTMFFVLIAVSVTIRTLDRLGSESTISRRLAPAIVVFWFVTSLLEIGPGTAIGLSVIIAVTLARPKESCVPESALLP